MCGYNRRMAEKLTSKLEAHRTAFLQKVTNGEIDGQMAWTTWFLSMVVFPSLKDIADRVDAIEASRRKGTDDGR